MAFAELPGIRLWYEEGGRDEAPPVLFIGGSGGDLRQKPNVFDGPLAKTFRVLAYDQRGLGRSEKPERAYTMAEYADDAAALLEARGLTACPVVGVSFGGMVAQHLAIRHPERVSKLVLCCTSSGGEGGSSYPLHELAGLAPEVRALRHLAIADTRYDEAWQRANPEEAAKLAEAGARRSQLAIEEPDPALEAGMRRQLEARSRHDCFADLPKIGCPTLLCAGRWDGIAPLANMDAIAARIAGSRLEIFEGGHLFLVQDRSAFHRIIAFLGEASGS